MFDFIGSNKRIIQIVLLLVAVPFLFFGVDSYIRSSGTGSGVARVGDYRISLQEFGNALRERQATLRQMMQGNIDASFLNSPEVRYATLDALIDRRLLIDRAIRNGMTVPDQEVEKIVVAQPAFKDEANRFSYQRYEQRLRSEGLTPVLFENQVRQDILLARQREGYFGSSFVPKSVLERMLDLAEQRREVSGHRIDPERFASEVQIGPDAVKQYYESHLGEFQVPERVKVDYVVLSADALASKIQLEEGEAERYYESRRREYVVPEARQASHILFAVDPTAGGDARKKAQDQANSVHAELLLKPERFAELAKKHSNDPGSAGNGGDIGMVGRGAMKDVPEFEDALFKMKEGEISAPVSSKLGFHIIKLTKIQPEQGMSFDKVRTKIEQELRKQRAGRRFAELADRFSNTVYEQSESLKPAAELAGATVQRSGWISRNSAEPPLLNNPKFIRSVFATDVLKDNRNSEAVEVRPNTLVAAHLVEHSPASARPLSEVSADIEKLLRRKETGERAAQAGRRELQALKEGKDVALEWSKPELIDRTEHKGFSEPMVRQAFRVDTVRLPAYAGVEDSSGGYMILRVTKVVPAETIPPEKRKGYAEALGRVMAEQEFLAYLSNLKQNTKIEIDKRQLESQGERQ